MSKLTHFGYFESSFKAFRAKSNPSKLPIVIIFNLIFSSLATLSTFYEGSYPGAEQRSIGVLELASHKKTFYRFGYFSCKIFSPITNSTNLFAHICSLSLLKILINIILFNKFATTCSYYVNYYKDD